LSRQLTQTKGISKVCVEGGLSRGGIAVAARVVRRNKHGKILCRHNRVLYYCVECGGGGICSHGKRIYDCALCKSNGQGKVGSGTGSCLSSKRVGGSDALSRQLTQTKGISKVCVEGGLSRGGIAVAARVVRRNKHGKILCRHNRVLYFCRDCLGKGICLHNFNRYYCKICRHNRSL
jgi:hypothetical protein